MRSKTATWFETKIKYDKTMEDGLEKSVREAYAVEALSFTEAEAAIVREMTPYISGEFSVVEEKIAAYKEVHFSDDDKADKFYKAKLAFITIDEKTDKEKRTAVYYLVQAASLEDARKTVDTVMGGTMLDYVLLSVSETALLDVFEHHALPDGVTVTVELSPDVK